jgi:hypothetical protein
LSVIAKVLDRFCPLRNSSDFVEKPDAPDITNRACEIPAQLLHSIEIKGLHPITGEIDDLSSIKVGSPTKSGNGVLEKHRLAHSARTP